MSRLLAWALLFMCVLALFTAPVVRAQEDGDDVEEVDTDAGDADVDPTDEDVAPEVKAAEEVFTTYLFTEYPDKKFPVGEKVTVLVGFSNKGNSVYNLTAIGASLHSPFDYNFYIQNFTYREINALIGPGEEGTIEYQFTPDKSLEALEFHMSLSMYYNDTTENKFWRSTILNGTVELLEAKSEFSAKSLFSWVLAFAGLGLAGYIGLNLSGNLNKATTSRSAPSASDRAAAAASWSVPEYKPKAKAGAFGASKRKASSKGAEASSPKSS